MAQLRSAGRDGFIDRDLDDGACLRPIATDNGAGRQAGAMARRSADRVSVAAG